jgi:hypothetical protein
MIDTLAFLVGHMDPITRYLLSVSGVEPIPASVSTEFFEFYAILIPFAHWNGIAVRSVSLFLGLIRQSLLRILFCVLFSFAQKMSGALAVKKLHRSYRAPIDI